MYPSRIGLTSQLDNLEDDFDRVGGKTMLL